MDIKEVDIKEVLEQHKLWVDGRGGKRANFSGAGLRWVNFPRASLLEVNFSGANLRGANFSEADLRWVNFSGASLLEANFSDAKLHWANFSGADLLEANFSGADLRGANFSEANLRGVKNLPSLAAARLNILPEGDIIGYKKLADGVIAKLLIPADSPRSNTTGRKCRCKYAIVLEGEGLSMYDLGFYYSPGKRVECDKWDPDRWNECSGGIHFFITREEAEDYR